MGWGREPAGTGAAFMIALAACKSILRHRNHLIAIALVALAAAASQEAAAQTPSSTSSGSSMADPAFIALVGVVVSALVSLILAWFTAHAAVRSEHAKRQSELALKIADMVSSPDKTSRLSAMRRFAVGFVKVVFAPEGDEQDGLVHFIPMNSRATVGRSKDNDIVLNDKEGLVSRWHCGFISDQHRVWLEDYNSKNGTVVGGEKVVNPRELKSGDEITIGPYTLHFRAVHPNTILAGDAKREGENLFRTPPADRPDL
jgi:hypothetical protein